MPKRSTEDYSNDDGFVEDAPVAKSKSGSSKKQKLSSDKTNASSGGDLPSGGHMSKDGEYWEISGKRRLQLSTFSGKQMVNIREYYESKEGEMLPGKKGISLTLEQFDTIITLLPAVEAVLKGKGHTAQRPDYDSVIATGAAGEGEDEVNDDDEDDDEEEDEMEDEDETEDAEENGRGKAGRGKKDQRSKKKKNFEDTSEDE